MSKDRINFFNQIKSFYELMWHGDFDFKPNHVSLYVFLLNQNNRSKWSKWFRLPRDTGMQGSCIGSKKTYYKCLSDLVDQKLIKKEDGINENKSPRISIIPLKRGEEIPIPVYHYGDTEGDTEGDTTYTAGGTQPIPLGVREEDYKTIDYKTIDYRQEMPKKEDFKPNPEFMKPWWEDEE